VKLAKIVSRRLNRIPQPTNIYHPHQPEGLGLTLIRLEPTQNWNYTTHSDAVALGLGGAGNDLLTHVMELGLQGLRCIAVDTDQYALQIAKAHSKLLIQSAVDTGTRGNAGVGRELGLQVRAELQSLVGPSDIVFILAGMGGGTGGGTAPIIAETARRNGALVIGLITKPFHFERGRFHSAVESVRQMMTVCDTVILIDNYTIDQSSMTLPFEMSLDQAGETCCSIIHSLTHTFTESTLCNAKLGELRTMLRRGGLAGASVGHSHSQLGAEEATLKVLRTTALHGHLAKANGVFVNITGGEHVQRRHVESAMDLVSNSIDPTAQLLYGHRVDAAMRGVTSVTLLATGLSFPASWVAYRRLPLQLYDLEAESGEEQDLSLELGLHQLESYAA